MNHLRRIVVTITGVFCVLLVFVSIAHISENVPAMTQVNTMPVIVIDPGHGGEDGGAVGAGGVVEKGVNLEISLKLRDMFIVNGFDVIMTRDTDVSIHDEGIHGTRKQKISDLHNREALINSQPDAVCLSIHQNIYGQKSSHGAQIFFSPNDPRSEALASALQDNFIQYLQPDNNRKYKKAGDNLYLMTRAQCPAVLIECGFLSNPADEANLVNEEYQGKIAFTVLMSTFEYLGLNNSAPSIFFLQEH